MTRIFFLVMRIITSEDRTFQKHSAKQLPFILHVRTNNKKGNDQRGGRIGDKAAGTKIMHNMKYSQRSNALMRRTSLLCYCMSLSMKGFGVSTFKIRTKPHRRTRTVTVPSRNVLSLAAELLG